ncbi:MAG: WbuC family cupin fold metalloprotein [Thermoanaerobaculia bacterium]
MTLPLATISDEVLVATDEVVRLDARAIDLVRDRASRVSRGRARICMHKSATDSLHEMLIAITATSYIRPHRHHARAESFHLVEGAADVVLLRDDGEIDDVVPLSATANFYYRLDTPRYHTLVVRTEIVVVHEITLGPFVPEESNGAPFAPAEGDPAAVMYKEELARRVGKWRQLHGLH